MIRRVFISHVHEEKGIALALQGLIYAQLGGTGGGGHVKVFLSSDKFQWRAGEDWLKRVRTELSRAETLVAVLSRRSLARHWVNLEAGAAWVLDRTIIPAIHSDLTTAELPRPYSDFNVVDLQSDPHHLLRSLGRDLPYPPPLSPDHPAHVALREALEQNRSSI